MTISFSRYVSIISGVAGASPVAVRQLIGRLFTNNSQLPAGSFVEFTSPADVGAFFGTNSEEYLRALFYFTWVSVGLTQAKKISYARWVSVAVAPQIFGNQIPKTLAAFQAITAGTFQLSLGGVSNTFGPLNFSAAGSLAAVATQIQNAINAISGTLWASATVAYNAQTNQFNFTGGVAGACALAVIDGTQNLAATLGWVPNIPETGQQITATNLATYAIWAPGAAIEDISASLGASASASNNFGSFLFQPTLTIDQMEEVATWTKGQNVLYRYCQAVNAANAADVYAALNQFGGTDLALSPVSGQYPEMVDMIQEAATDYTLENSTSDYMYKVFAGLDPSVTDDEDANTYDAMAINYYGITQESGNTIAFWQRGVMQGGPTDPLDSNVFSNESWLKSYIGAGIINLQLGLQKISAGTLGENKIVNVLAAADVAAKFNGTVLVGKPFTPQQIAAINDFTGSQTAWRQVQSQGSWYNCTIVPYTDPTTNRSGYEAVYTYVYSKDDVVRFVSGQNVLI